MSCCELCVNALQQTGVHVCITDSSNKALQDVRGRGGEGTDSMQHGTTGCEGEGRGRGLTVCNKALQDERGRRGGGGGD